MKPFLLMLAGALLTGCAGYNHTLFMTKSNAGLDFDAKPPTAEITVARKEAVIAPAFESGQTPPVIASFKPKSGFDGSFANFFMGVDQTFAGGDAAVAMSKLYSQPTRGSTNFAEYDSSLYLSEAPKYRNVFQHVPGSGKTRPFIFGTDTMIGLKVAWSGVGGQFPDSLKAGFNRKEFAWAPLSVTNTGSGARVKMPAFLATIESHVGGGRTNEIQALQYFATGTSATYLTLQPKVRAALIERFDPNEDEFASREFDFSTDEASEAIRQFLFPVNTQNRSSLTNWIASSDVAGSEIEALITSPGNAFQAARKKAVADLSVSIPSGVAALPEDQKNQVALRGFYSPRDSDADKKIQEWLREHGLSGLTTTELLSNSRYAPERAQMVRDLRIPVIPQ